MNLHFSKREIIIVGALLVMAFWVRIVAISYPEHSVFDEGFYQVLSSRTTLGLGYFDIHPSFAVQVFSEIARSAYLPEQIVPFNVSFGTFPFVSIRIFNAIIGTLLVLVVYLISRPLIQRQYLRFLPAFFAAFDPALIMYSRRILPDMLLLFTGILGIAFLAIPYFSGRKILWRHVLLAGLAVGCAVSIKWTALGFFLAGAAFLLARKHYARIGIFLFIILVVYAGVFARFYLNATPDGIKHYKERMYLKNVEFPRVESAAGALVFLPRYTKLMYELNYQPDFFSNGHPGQSKPQQWLVGMKPLYFSKMEYMAAAPNVFSWILIPVALLIFAAGFIASLFKKVPRPPEQGMVLFLAYTANFLPFFFISRMMFIYHYFPALMFGYLLVSLMIEYGFKFLERPLSEKTELNIVRGIAIVTLVVFVLVSPVLYGV